jgi:hypothetical protein
MKKILAFVCLNYCFVFFAVSVSAQPYQTIKDVIEYAKLTRKIKDDPIVVNLLRVDLSKVRLDVVHAADAAIGTETTSLMAARHNAFAAINAGFFRLDRSVFAGDSVGVLQIDGELISESFGNRIAFGIVNGKNKTEIGFKHLETKINLLQGKDSRSFFSGVNRERKSDEMILFTPQFGKTTLTDSTGTEIIVRKGKVTNIIQSKGNNEIPRDGFVVSAIGKKREEILPKVKIGKTKTAKINSGVMNFFISFPKSAVDLSE